MLIDFKSIFKQKHQNLRLLMGIIPYKLASLGINLSWITFYFF